MLLTALKKRLRRRGPIPYDMFDRGFLEREARTARSLSAVYHKGQERIWDGREVLAALVQKHGGIHIAPERLESISRVLAILFWGELAAWKVSSELALHTIPLEAKLAATAQAHDEARHFYVLHDYLQAIGYEPERLPGAAATMLAEVTGASHLAKKLVGMQLMVEPVALTLFHLIREQKVEPVLCELLGYYARDEARHVALGVHWLPHVVRDMTRGELLDLWQWQLRLLMVELRGLKEIEGDIRALGFEPRQVYRLAQAKQVAAVQLVQERLGGRISIIEPFVRLMELRLELDFSRDPDQSGIERWRTALTAAFRATGQVDLDLAHDIRG